MLATDLQHPGRRPTVGRALAITATFAFGWAAVSPASGWSPIGPSGGTFSSVTVSVVSTSNLVCATYSGVIWHSTDGGLYWDLAGSLAGDQPWAAATRLASSFTQAANLYASTQSGAFRSTDFGATWRALEPGITGLAIAPSGLETLYATRLMAGPGAPGTYVLAVDSSTDGGATWRVAGVLPQSWQAAELAVDPFDIATVYALGTPGLAKSTDGGAHWATLFSPYGAGDSPIALIVDPRHASTLYIASEQAAGGGGASVWRSGDGGVSWAAADAGLPRPLYSLALAPSGSLYAAALVAAGTQVFASADGGTTWQQTATLGVIAQVAAGLDTPDHLFALTYQNGMLASLDQGHTWSVPVIPPSGADVTQVLSGPAPNGELYVVEAITASKSQFQRSLDRGLTWSPLAPTKQEHSQRLVLDAQPGRLYAFGSLLPNQELFSVDDGASWQTMPTPGGLTALDLVADPAAPGKLLELACPVTSDTPHGGPACSSYSLYRSNTFGRSWRLLGTLEQGGYPAGLVRLDPADPTTAYAVIGGTIYKTTAGSPGLRRLPFRLLVADLAADPKTPGILYAAIAISAPNDLRRPLWKSTDGGASWAPASAGLPRGGSSPVLAIDPTNSSTLYLGNSQSLFVSDDGARTWQPMSVGLVGLRVTSLAKSTIDYHILFAGTQSAGAFINYR
jgi:photosystem II stability/assembly factor-like uncharacterized protein